MGPDMSDPEHFAPVRQHRARAGPFHSDGWLWPPCWPEGLLQATRRRLRASATPGGLLPHFWVEHRGGIRARGRGAVRSAP
eukprot:14312969-Alexandrium_andersonii.AAC.1